MQNKQKLIGSSKVKSKVIRNAKNFDEVLNIQYGIIGSKKRDEFEIKAKNFVISEMLQKGFIHPINDSKSPKSL